MTAAATGGDSPIQPGHRLVGKVAPETRVFQGALIALARYGEHAGYYVPASDDPSLLVLGQATATVPPSDVTFDNPLALSSTVTALRGPQSFAVDGGITEADRGSMLYVIDDKTLSLDSAGGLRPVAGPCLLVEADGTSAMVDIGALKDDHGELLDRIEIVAESPEAWQEELTAAALTQTWTRPIAKGGPIQIWWRSEGFTSPGGGVFNLTAGLNGGGGTAYLGNANVRAAGSYSTAMPAGGMATFHAPGGQVDITLTDAADNLDTFTAGRLIVEIRRAQ